MHRGGAIIRFDARSTNPPERSGLTSYRNQADLFAVYAPHTKQVYVLPVDECGEVGVWLRLTPAKNNQHLKVRLAEEYTLTAWAERTIHSQARPAITISDAVSGATVHTFPGISGHLPA